MTNFYKLENQYLSITVSSMGATLVSFIDKQTGKDIVTGFDSPEGYYQYRDCYMGAMVGRCANRIAHGHFEINGVGYDVPINQGPNSLHGGLNGLTYVEYDVETIENGLKLHYLSKDGEEGYPGNLSFDVEYFLEDRNLTCVFSGSSDKDTVFNITNHAYFNLNGGVANVLDQSLFVPSTAMSYTDDSGLTYEEISDISGTYYDFSKMRSLGECLKNVDIDNNYHFDGFEEKLMARLENDELSLEVWSDLPDMHIYPGNHFNNIHGKNGLIYNKNYGIALEAQFYPNAINYRSYPKPILKKDEAMSHKIVWKLKVKQ